MNNNFAKEDRKFKLIKCSYLIISIFFLVAIVSFVVYNEDMTSNASGATLYVGGGGPDNYTAIQDAVNASQPGDTVYVYSRIYYENIHINKSINLVGEDTNTTVINGSGSGIVVYLDSTDYVNITGFTIEYGECGIYLDQASHSNISNNRVRRNVENTFYFSIDLTSSLYNNFYRNEIYDNELGGFFISYSSYNNFYGNEIHDNKGDGIKSDYSSNNNYINNTVHDLTGSGTRGFFFSGTPYHDNHIVGNTVYNIHDGIRLESQGGLAQHWSNWVINNTVYNYEASGINMQTGYNNCIIGNTVYNITTIPINPEGGINIYGLSYTSVIGNVVHNGSYGIDLDLGGIPFTASNNTIRDNIVYNNEIGIRLRSAMDNTFIENTVFNNNYSVYMLSGSLYQTTGNNFINNTLSNANINVYMSDAGHNNFINNTLSKAVINDFYLTDDSHATALNTNFDKTKVTYGDQLSDLTVKWYMHVKVVYSWGKPVVGANVTVVNETHDLVADRTTGLDGRTKWIVCTEYFQNKTGKVFHTPHNVTATKYGTSGYVVPEPFMNISKVVLIILGTPPPLLPPTNLTTKVVNNGNNVELEWDPPSSLALDHYLIYRADSATEFDFTTPYNISTTWPNPKNTTWVDLDPNITAVDDDFYYIVRAANFDESIVSLTSNTAGIWTRTFESGISTFSLPLEPFMKKDTEFYCQNMNASYIKWMNQTTHTWIRHDKGSSENNTLVEVGKGYEIGFLGKSTQTKYTFTGMPGAMILYDNISFGFDATPLTGDAVSLTAKVDNNGNITLNWTQPTNIGSGDQYYVLRSTSRDGFWGTEGVNYTQLAVLPFNILLYQDIGNATPGTEYYYMIVPVNFTTGERGVSSYSIGVWTAGYLDQYDTFALPLKLSSYKTVDWYCDNIPETVGINYYINSEQRWGWHSTRMPSGAYDPLLVIAEGYQISTFGATKFTFIGR